MMDKDKVYDQREGLYEARVRTARAGLIHGCPADAEAMTLDPS
jgi:hypothetical protein